MSHSFATAAASPIDTDTRESFLPLAPSSFAEAGLSERQIEEMALKFLLQCGSASGRRIAEQLAVPFVVLQPLLFRLKQERLVIYKVSAPLSDYLYELTDVGLDRAGRHFRHNSYHGTAPVPLCDYVAAIEAQSVRKETPSLDDLHRAFDDLVMADDAMVRLGEAISSGLGFFLFGAPGNGKTSIAERTTKAMGEAIWIPRTISVGGEIIRLYDTSKHEALPLDDDSIDPNAIDRRWVRIRRPTIVVGGELTLDELEVTPNRTTGVLEASLQMKSNGGTLVVDDLGRQQIQVSDLLNRWIVPLERRFDFVTTTSGQRFQVPFDQLVIFSTNLPPSALVDEAFLRRIPYKIDVRDPSEAELHELFRREAAKANLAFDGAAVDHLLQKHYREAKRPMRFCHPRDLVHQVETACKFRKLPRRLTSELLDAAVENYFSIL